MQGLGGDLTALVAAVEANGHSVFAPSAAHRWMKCHASIRDTLLAVAARRDTLVIDEEGEEVEDHGSGSSFFSVEGSAAHDLAEVWLRNGAEPTALLGTKFVRDGIEIEYDNEMFAEVGRYVEWCQELRRAKSDIERVETRVDVSWLFPIPRQGGTCDHMHLEWLMPLRGTRRARLTITDLKYGKGVKVFAERNPQLMIYALGAIKFLRGKYGVFEVVEIVIRICQPRLEHFDVWQVPNADLSNFEAEIAKAAHACWAPNPQYHPDPKGCRFCPVKSSCKALVAEMQSFADEAFGNLEGEEADLIDTEIPVEGAHMSIARKAEILRWRPTFDSFFKRLEADLFRHAESGETVPNFKIVEGRQSRAWTNAKKAAEWLELLGLTEEQIWVRKLISPHQAELALRKLIRRAGKSVIGSEVTSVAGPRTLAPIIDSRSELAGSADVFEPIEDDEDLS